MIQVLVKRPNDGTLVFQVDRLNRVSELKQMIEERSGVAPELQFLQFGEKQYADEVTIEDIYNKSSCFQDNEVPVLMSARLRGGVNIVHHLGHYHEDLRKGVAQSCISSGDGADGSSYLRQSDPDAGTENVPAERLKQWRQVALVLIVSRRFRYTLDLKKEEERETIRRKTRARAQVIRQVALVRIVSRRLLKKEEERETIRRKTRARAQVIRVNAIPFHTFRSYASMWLWQSCLYCDIVVCFDEFLFGWHSISRFSFKNFI